MTQDGGSPQLCIQREGSYSCINRNTPVVYSVGVWSKYQEFIPVSDQNTYPLWVRLSLDAKGSIGERTVKYKNIRLTAYTIVKEYQYTEASVIKDLEGGYINSASDRGNKIEVVIPDYWGNSAEALGLDFSMLECSLKNRVFSKELSSVLVHIKDRSCTLSYIFPSNVGENGLLLGLDYTSDLPLEGVEVCLANTKTGNCDIKQVLKGKYYFLPHVLGNGGSSVHLTNIAVGKNEIAYTLKKAVLSEFPVDWMMAIKWVKNSPLPEIKDGRYLFKIAVRKYSGIYFVDKTNLSGDRSVVFVDQAFENGWVAWCGFKPCQAEHVLVNNWANGWVFNHDGAISSSSQNVLIFFWPQILEYLGFGFLIVWFGFGIFLSKDLSFTTLFSRFIVHRLAVGSC